MCIIKAEIYGWGSEKFEDPKIKLGDVPMSKVLKEIEIMPVSAGQCVTILNRTLTSNQVCVKGIDPGETAAQVINCDHTNLTHISIFYPKRVLIKITYCNSIYLRLYQP